MDDLRGNPILGNLRSHPEHMATSGSALLHWGTSHPAADHARPLTAALAVAGSCHGFVATIMEIKPTRTGIYMEELQSYNVFELSWIIYLWVL